MKVVNGPNKRHKGRKERELSVIVAGTGKQVFSLDFSQGGIRIAGVGLDLTVGSVTNFSFNLFGKNIDLVGTVSRDDGKMKIKRAGVSGNVFFIKVDDYIWKKFIKEELGLP